VLVLLVATLSVVAADIVALASAPDFHRAAIVTPWIALAVMFQGLYLVGSIGLVITKRTTVYPIATGIAASVSVAANVLLVPRSGMLGAAWATVIAYATLAAVTSVFSWRAYPIPYEWGRLARVAVAGAVAFFAGTTADAMASPALLGLLAGSAATVASYVVVLLVTGFFHAGELRVLRDLRARARAGRDVPVLTPSTNLEMAGEIISTPPDMDAASMEVEVPRATPGSRDPRR
jgi:O-antigen/teichoic acid export membrane protein